MPDPLRAALFTLALAALGASSLAIAAPLRLGGAGTVLALWVVGAGQVVLLAEALSLLWALDWLGFLAGHLLIAGGVVAWAARRPRAERWLALHELRAGLRRLAPAVWDWGVPAVPLLAGATLLVGLISATLALLVPPNSVDALAYHLARVGYYLQFRSLAPYPTDDFRQVAFPPNAELLILWTVAFLRADQLASTVQLLAWAATAIGVYGLGRQVGLGPRGALFGSSLFALLPQAVLQSTSTLNDLVVASFLVASLLFLLQAALAPRPTARLALAGAAAGLAVGTKGTALLALPGLAIVFVVLFGGRLERRVCRGVLLGGVAAALLGSYIYVQNWSVYGSPTGPAMSLPPDRLGVLALVGLAGLAVLLVARRLGRALRAALLGGLAIVVLSSAVAGPSLGAASGGRSDALLRERFVANLARTLFQFAFTDLSGPLASPIAAPLAEPLARALGAAGERLFAALGIPTVVEGVEDEWTPQFSFVRAPRLHELVAGVGPIGGLALAVAAAAMVWPGRVPTGCRLLGLAALSYLAATALVVPWNAYGAGRYLLTACALAAPLPGLLLQRRTAWRQALALFLAIWSGVTGLYVSRFSEHKPLRGLADQDRLGAMILSPAHQAFFRAVEAELGPTSTIAVYGDVHPRLGMSDQWEYPFFGPRLTRTVLPLVGAGYVRRMGLRGPPPWSNEDLLASYRPHYVALQADPADSSALPASLPDRCWQVPLRYGRPAVRWQIWRCEDRDPRSLVDNGDFAAWPGDPGPFVAEDGVPPVAAAGWEAEVNGDGRLQVTRLEPAEGEPFRLRLEYRGGTGDAGIAQALPLDGLRGRILAVDARVRADRPEAALLWVDDGVTQPGAANRTTRPESLRIEHRVDERARALWVGLDASAAGGDAVVEVRTILAIPR